MSHLAHNRLFLPLATAPIFLYCLTRGSDGYVVVILKKLGFVQLGLVTWEVVVRLPFDWSIISSKVRYCRPFLYHINLRTAHTPLGDGSAEWNLIADMHSVKRGGRRSSTFTADTRSGSPSFSPILLQTRPARSTAKRSYVLCCVIHLYHLKTEPCFH